MAALKAAKSTWYLEYRHWFLNKFPEPLDQVEIRRIGRQKTEFDVQTGRGGHDQGASLIAGIVQKNGDRYSQVEPRQLTQKYTDLSQR